MKLNSFQLKIIAIVLMTLSHIQYHIGISTVLYIGQASFPIFAFLCAYSATKTRNITKFFLRLLIFGIIIQIPLLFLNENYINIFITLALGVGAIYAVKSYNYYLLMPIFLFAYFTNLDYGVFGILVILGAYLLNFNKLYFSILLIVLQFIWIEIFNDFSFYQWYALLAIPLITLYNFEPGSKKFKYLFYIYYPLHTVVIYGISLII
ncbi:MAG: TraX family protein [Bacilli bacterium]